MKTVEIIMLETYDKVNNLEDNFKKTIKVLNEIITDLQQTTLKQQKQINELIKRYNDNFDI